MLGAADEVPQPVGEVFPVARLGNHVPGGLVQLAQGHPGTDQGFSRLVGPAHQVMDGCVLVGNTLAEIGAGHVRAVPILPAANVQYDAVPLLQDGVVRHVMGIGGVGAKGDNGGEGGFFAPQFLVLSHQKVGHLPLGHALPNVGHGTGHGLVVEPGVHAHQLLLGGVLPGPHTVHAVAGQLEGGAGQPLHQGQQEPGRPLFVNAQRFPGLYPLSHHPNGVVGIAEPHLLQGSLRHGEEFVQKEHVVAVGPQVQGE